jgi:hypothetical protein
LEELAELELRKLVGDYNPERVVGTTKPKN